MLIPEINLEQCQVCTPCHARMSCKTRAIVQIDPDEPPYIEPDRCNRCAVCVLACCCGAIKMGRNGASGSGSISWQPLIKSIVTFLIIIQISLFHVGCQKISNTSASQTDVIRSTPTPTNSLSENTLAIPPVIEPQSVLALGPSQSIPLPGANEFTWMPDNNSVVAATDGQVVIYDLRAEKLEFQIAADIPGQVQAQSVQEQPLLAWMGSENSIYTWKPTSDTQPKTLIQETQPLTSMAVSPAQDAVVYATYDGRVILIDPATNQIKQQWQPPAWLTNLSVSPDGKYLGGADPTNFQVQVYDIQTSKKVQTLEWHDQAIPVLYGAFFSPDWSKVAWVARNSVLLSDVSSGVNGPVLDHEDFVGAMAWSPDSKTIATAAASSVYGTLTPVVILWEAESGRLLRILTMDSPVQNISFSPDNRKLAILTTKGQLDVWVVQK